MNRRGFIGALAAAAFALDPDHALWVPGAKLISIPAPPPELSVLTTRAFLEVGDVVTFGHYPERYMVTVGAASLKEIDTAQFVMIPFISITRPGPWVRSIPSRDPDEWPTVMRREPR